MRDALTPRQLPDGWAASIIGGELAVAGVTVRALADRVGGTPFFAYDRERISRRVRQVRGLLPPRTELHYSVKANPLPSLLRHLAALVDGMDVASTGELAAALAAGVPASEVGFAGPGKSDAELRAAAAAGVLASVESLGELERLCNAGLALGVRPRVLIRVNPDFEIRGGGLAMGGGAKPFGIDQEAVPAALRRLGQLDLGFEGFHLYWGSQILDAERIAEAQSRTADALIALSQHAPCAPRLLNLGGGFGIPYGPTDMPLDPASLARGMAVAAARIVDAVPDARMILELGRYLVGEAGVYVCKVLDRKVSRGEVFLVTDGGLHHHLAASGNFGQALRRDFPVAVATRMDRPPTERVTIVGRLCTPLDRLATRTNLPEAVPGDLIAVFQSGAYGASASPAGFLSHGPAAEILL